MYCALVDILPSTPLGKATISSRCSFHMFPYGLDKDYHLITMISPDSHNFKRTVICTSYYHAYMA